VTGKQKLKNALGKTQAEVKEKLEKAIADSQRLDMNRSGSHTVKTWVKMWYEVYAEPKLREKTKGYYLNYIDNHIIPWLQAAEAGKAWSVGSLLSGIDYGPSAGRVAGNPVGGPGCGKQPGLGHGLGLERNGKIRYNFYRIKTKKSS
jgi:hypothetical protein